MPVPDASTESPRAAVPHDLRMLPAALAVWLGAWIGTAERPWLAALTSAVASLAVLVGLRRRSVLLAAVGLLLIGATLIGGARVQALRTGPLGGLAADQAMVAVELVPRTDLQRTSGAGGEVGWLRAEARVVEGRGERHRILAPVVVLITGSQLAAWDGIVAGARIRADARLAAPDPGQDVAAVVRIRGAPHQLAPPGPAWRQIEEVRAGLRQAVADRTPEQRALVPALVLGDTSQMTEELRQQFAVTGLVHLTAVSGANLTLLLVFLVGTARAVGVRGGWLRVVGLVGVVVFIALCRAEPSVLRAAAMGLVALAAFGVGGRGERRGLRHLGVAVTVLMLVDPWLSRSVGMALSVLASAGIVWWAGPWAERLGRWLPRWVAESVAVPLAAQLATQPVVTAISGQVSVVGLVANALAAPFVGPATVLGFAAAGASVLWMPLAEFIALLASLSVQGIVWVSRYGVLLPGAQTAWPAGAVPVAVLAVGCLLVAGVLPWLLTRRWCCLAVAAVMLAALLRPPGQPGWPPPSWVLVTCDVGQGDAVLLRAGPDAAVVVDAGPDPVALDRCLRAADVERVPLLVLSHFHADHVDGLPALLEGPVPEVILVSPVALPVGQYQRVTGQLAAAGITPRVTGPGERWQVGAVGWQTLGPLPTTTPVGSDSGEGESAAENDASVVGVATVAGVSVLFTGDIGADAQQGLVRAYGAIRADVLKVPHHGSGDQDAAFLDGTGAVIAVTGVGADNSYGHPAARTLDLLTGDGARVLRTDTMGSIALSGDATTGLRVTTQR